MASVERGLEHLDLVRPLYFGLGVGEPRLGLGDPSLCRRDRGLLLGAFQREDGIALLDGSAFLDAERKHAAALLGADQHQVGLHIAGELRVLVGREGEQHDGHGDCGETGEQENCATLHRFSPVPLSTGSRPGALMASVKSSILVASSPSVSR